MIKAKLLQPRLGEASDCTQKVINLGRRRRPHRQCKRQILALSLRITTEAEKQFTSALVLYSAPCVCKAKLAFSAPKSFHCLTYYGEGEGEKNSSSFPYSLCYNNVQGEGLEGGVFQFSSPSSPPFFKSGNPLPPLLLLPEKIAALSYQKLIAGKTFYVVGTPGRGKGKGGEREDTEDRVTRARRKDEYFPFKLQGK